MKTGLLAGHHLLLHRATFNLNLSPNWSAFQAVLVHRAPPRAHVHNSVPRRASFPLEALYDEEIMFGRAVQARAAEANNNNKPKPGVSSINNNASLKQQLFPSSSPARAPSAAGSQSKTSLADMFKKPGFGGTSSGAISASSRTTTTNDPLSTRPANSAPRPLPHYGNNSRAFASLYNASDSFNDTPDVIDLTMQPTKRSTSDLTSSVYIDDDDFSDDENLDLDFEAPSALPTLPSGRVSLEQHRQMQMQQEDEAREARFHEPPPGTHTSVLSWSDSSPSHHQPPKRELNPPLKTNAKRDRLQDDDEVDFEPPVAVKKPKRELPWETEPKPQQEEWDHTEEYVQEKSGYAPTPASKPKGSMLWNTTASAVKEQKKQLKDRQKSSSVAPKTEVPMDEIQKVISSHMSKASAITLSGEQLHVKSLVVEKGQSVFFTGPAGTGKSVLMRAIISELKKKYAREPERVAVTASTGLAACNIGGMTLHSFAGIGLGKEDVMTLVKKIRRNQKAKNRWLKTKVLIIDEISMVDGELFDKLSQIGRTIRNNGRPWGGIQLVITGDFFQLPPVPDNGPNKARDVKFAFDAATWNMSIDHTIGLTEVFRQRDPEFAEMLNEMRLGRISDKTVKNFQQLSRPLSFDDGLEVTELFPTRNEVENSNRQRLAALKGKVYRYEAYDTGEPAIREKLLANMMAPPVIELKKDAQVMLIKNMDETLVNGSLGTVVGFMNEATFELKANSDFDDDEDLDKKRRIKAFTSALSNAAIEKGDNTEYPLVRFHAVDGTRRDILCQPEDWKVELPTGEIQASRKQLPLILAWALSIHKAQGQTLERVKVDLGRVFEKGQAYVALSRATTQQGLQVLRFQKDKVMAHPRVVSFYNKLYSAESAVMKTKVDQPITKFAYKTPSLAQTIAKTQQRRQVINADGEEKRMASYG